MAAFRKEIEEAVVGGLVDAICAKVMAKHGLSSDEGVSGTSSDSKDDSVGVGGDTEAARSWSDEMEEVETLDSSSGSDRSTVEMPENAFVKGKVVPVFGSVEGDNGDGSGAKEVPKVGVRFDLGAAGDVNNVVPLGPCAVPDVERGAQNELAGYTRSHRVLELKAFVESLCGCRIPKNATYELALAGFTLGTVPTAFADGRARLRILEFIGDAALSVCDAVVCFEQGLTVEEAQRRKSARFSNANLSRVCVDSGLVRHLVVLPGINMRTAKTGANAVEAVVGLVSMRCGVSAVRRLVHGLNL